MDRALTIDRYAYLRLIAPTVRPNPNRSPVFLYSQTGIPTRLRACSPGVPRKGIRLRWTPKRRGHLVLTDTIQVLGSFRDMPSLFLFVDLWFCILRIRCIRSGNRVVTRARLATYNA